MSRLVPDEAAPPTGPVGQAPPSDAAPGPGLRHRIEQWIHRSGRRLVTAVPYLWLLLFFLLPFGIVLKIALSEAAIARPPYSPLVEFLGDGVVQITVSLRNFGFILSDSLYTVAYLNSVKIALVSTVIALIVGYPMAYAIAKAPRTWRGPLLMMIILPFWTSFLIRVYAWIGLLNDTGLINGLLMGLGLIDRPIQMIRTDFAVYLGIVYSYLPFMILPLYATLERMDDSLVEAALDLGCRPWQAFVKVTLPLSLPGIVAGSLLVFIPAVGEFVIPELLGGPDTLMIGKILWQEFFNNRDWPVASAVAIALLLVLVLPIMAFQHFQSREAGGR